MPPMSQPVFQPQSLNMSLDPCCLGGPEMGNGYNNPCLLGGPQCAARGSKLEVAQIWAKWPHNPCLLRGPQCSAQKSKSPFAVSHLHFMQAQSTPVPYTTCPAVSPTLPSCPSATALVFKPQFIHMQLAVCLHLTPFPVPLSIFAQFARCNTPQSTHMLSALCPPMYPALELDSLRGFPRKRLADK